MPCIDPGRTWTSIPIRGNDPPSPPANMLLTLLASEEERNEPLLGRPSKGFRGERAELPRREADLDRELGVEDVTRGGRVCEAVCWVEDGERRFIQAVVTRKEVERMSLSGRAGLRGEFKEIGDEDRGVDEEGAGQGTK